MKKKYWILGVGAVLLLIAGAVIYIRMKSSVYEGKYGSYSAVTDGADGPTALFIAGKFGEVGYITMEEAKEFFASAGDYIILDVRKADEFAEGHIPGAVNIANEDIGTIQPEELPETDKMIFVYCRSGRRSKEAAEKLTAMGYTKVVDCGGILDWTGDIEK